MIGRATYRSPEVRTATRQLIVAKDAPTEVEGSDLESRVVCSARSESAASQEAIPMPTRTEATNRRSASNGNRMEGSG